MVTLFSFFWHKFISPAISRLDADSDVQLHNKCSAPMNFYRPSENTVRRRRRNRTSNLNNSNTIWATISELDHNVQISSHFSSPAQYNVNELRIIDCKRKKENTFRSGSKLTCQVSEADWLIVIILRPINFANFNLVLVGATGPHID